MDCIRLAKWDIYSLTIDEEDTFEILFVPYMERSEITLDENLQFKSENLKRRIDDTQTILKS